MFEFNEDFIENYNEDNNIGYIPKVGVKYLHESYEDLLFSLEEMKIEKCNNILRNLNNKKNMLNA